MNGKYLYLLLLYPTGLGNMTLLRVQKNMTGTRNYIFSHPSSRASTILPYFKPNIYDKKWDLAHAKVLDMTRYDLLYSLESEQVSPFVPLFFSPSRIFHSFNLHNASSTSPFSRQILNFAPFSFFTLYSTLFYLVQH